MEGLISHQLSAQRKTKMIAFSRLNLGLECIRGVIILRRELQTRDPISDTGVDPGTLMATFIYEVNGQTPALRNFLLKAFHKTPFPQYFSGSGPYPKVSDKWPVWYGASWNNKQLRSVPVTPMSPGTDRLCHLYLSYPPEAGRGNTSLRVTRLVTVRRRLANGLALFL